MNDSLSFMPLMLRKLRGYQGLCPNCPSRFPPFFRMSNTKATGLGNDAFYSISRPDINYAPKV